MSDTNRLYDAILADDRFFLAAIAADTPEDMKRLFLRHRGDYEALTNIDANGVKWSTIYDAIKNIGGEVDLAERD